MKDQSSWGDEQVEKYALEYDCWKVQDMRLRLRIRFRSEEPCYQS